MIRLISLYFLNTAGTAKVILLFSRAPILRRASQPLSLIHISHSHFTGALQYLLYADLSECTSFAEITETLKKFAAERNIGPDGVIMGNGYDQNNLIEQRHPDKSILNAVSEDVPVLITHVSNHMGVANDCLLKLAGITPTTPDPEGGR